MPRILSENKPSKHKKAVVFCADRNVFGFAQFVASQIMRAEPARDYDICITTFDGSFVQAANIDPEIRVCQVDETAFHGLHTDARITSTAYILLALPELFKNDYDKIVYLDTDVYLANGKISQLFAAASDKFSVSGVMDNGQWHGKTTKGWNAYFAATGVVGKPYLNAGVLVLDVKKCVAEQFFDGTMQMAAQRNDLVKAHPGVTFYHDQTAINRFLKGRWAPLSVRWNWQVDADAARLSKHFDPHIVHFIGRSKPWAFKPAPFSKKYLPEYQEYFSNVLHADVFANTRKPQKQASSIRQWMTLINPFSYTGIHGLYPMYQKYRFLKQAEKAIAAGHPVWPRADMEKALK